MRTILCASFFFTIAVISALRGKCEGRLSSDVRSGESAGELLVLKFCEGTEVKFSWCPAGRFMMGSPVSEPERDDDERQVHVTLTKGFWISQTEVTQQLWTEVMLSTPWGGINGLPNIPKLPATNISYADANRFCACLTTEALRKSLLQATWGFRLPTEAQWEYACRAGTSSAYSFGDSPKELGEHAWFYKNRRPDNEMLMAQMVGQLKPNRWGLHDMMGNVHEWCLDVWDEEYAGGTDPLCAPVGRASNELYIQRGGHFEVGAARCRSASRSFSSPEIAGEYAGFRIVLMEIDKSGEE